MDSPASEPLTAFRDDPRGLRVTDIGLTLLRTYRIWLAAPLVLMLLMSVYLLIRPTRYTASAAFIVQGGSTIPSGIGALAAQFGAGGVLGDASESPEFYADLLTSDAFLRELVTAPLAVSGSPGDSITMSAIYASNEVDAGVAQEKAVEQLRDHLAVSVGAATGVVTVSATTSQPYVSAQLIARALESLNRFNVDVRRTQASEERRFVEGRLDEAGRALRAGEDSLEVFLKRNREFRNSPTLTFDFERLQRMVAIRQSIFTGLAQTYEQVRASEVRNTPVIAIVGAPIVPPRADQRSWLLRLTLSGAIGLALGVFGALFFDFLKQSAEGDPAMKEAYEVAMRRIHADVTRLGAIGSPDRGKTRPKE